MGRNFIQIPSTGSTNSYAAELLSAAPAEGTVVRAQAQTAGRGQSGAPWVSEPGKNLTFSVILYPRGLDPRHTFDLNRALTVALHETVRSLVPAETELFIKWPNDLIANRKKLSGILIENEVTGGTWKSAVLGVGLNVNQTDFPPELRDKAVSLAQLCGEELQADAVLEALLSRLEARYLALRQGRFAGTEDYFLHHLYGYQERCTFRIEDSVVEATLVGVDAEGRLALDIGGELRRFGNKELEFCL